jgi:hypothetical protein
MYRRIVNVLVLGTLFCTSLVLAKLEISEVDRLIKVNRQRVVVKAIITIENPSGPESETAVTVCEPEFLASQAALWEVCVSPDISLSQSHTTVRSLFLSFKAFPCSHTHNPPLSFPSLYYIFHRSVKASTKRHAKSSNGNSPLQMAAQTRLSANNSLSTNPWRQANPLMSPTLLS